MPTPDVLIKPQKPDDAHMTTTLDYSSWSQQWVIACPFPRCSQPTRPPRQYYLEDAKLLIKHLEEEHGYVSKETYAEVMRKYREQAKRVQEEIDRKVKEREQALASSDSLLDQLDAFLASEAGSAWLCDQLTKALREALEKAKRP